MSLRFYLSISIFLVITLSGCQHLKHPITAVKKVAIELLPPYSGLKASITIADFDAKTPKVNNEVNLGLRQMLVSALSNTNRFIVSGQQPLAKNIPIASDLVVAVTVVQFEPQTSGGATGVGGGGSSNSGFFGGLLGRSVSKAHMTWDIRLIKFSTSEVLASAQIRGQASDAKMDRRILADTCPLTNGLSDFENTVMEKAIRRAVMEAAGYITETIPAGYFKYK